jgi:ribonuclease HI
MIHDTQTKAELVSRSASDGDGDLPAEVTPLHEGVLAARRAVIVARRRERRLAKPAYVNTDASWRVNGVAGIAYSSEAIGMRAELVECGDNLQAEYLAMIMAMGDAELCLTGPIHFRTDCETVACLQGVTSPELKGLRARVAVFLDSHPEWKLQQVERKSNQTANRLARRIFREPHKCSRRTSGEDPSTGDVEVG